MDLHGFIDYNTFSRLSTCFFNPKFPHCLAGWLQPINDSHNGGSSRHFTSIFTQCPTQT